MGGVKDRLGDLSWLGDAYADQGWVEVGEEALIPMTAEEVDATVAQLLIDTAWAVAEDNTSMTKEQRIKWLEFRQSLRDIPLQVGFPENVQWPSEPA
jgi:hypothetical protein